MTRDLIEATKYGSNLTNFDFTLNACGFMLALFPAYMVDNPPARVACVSLPALGRPAIRPYMTAVRDQKWVTEKRGCPRLCPKSWTIEATALGCWVIAAFRDRQGEIAGGWLKAGGWFRHMLRTKSAEVVRASLELAADLPPAECIGNREWRARVEGRPS